MMKMYKLRNDNSFICSISEMYTTFKFVIEAIHNVVISHYKEILSRN